MKREVPIAITTLLAILMIVANFFTNKDVRTLAADMTNWGVIISAFATGLAAVGLIIIHLNKISRGASGWGYSVALLVALFAMILAGTVFGTKSKFYGFLNSNMLIPMSAAVFSILVFYIGSAAFRAFRLRNLDGGLLLLAGVLLMLGRAPLGEAVWKGFPKLADWLMKYPNLAANRAVLIGATIGSVALGLRVLAGIERGHLGGGE